MFKFNGFLLNTSDEAVRISCRMIKSFVNLHDVCLKNVSNAKVATENEGRTGSETLRENLLTVAPETAAE